MEWSIQEIARATGTTSRTLRHYGDIGLLEPSRVGHNGYRYYDQDALLRLQRILLLRDLGLGLSAIAEVLAGQRDPIQALHTHLELLERERERLGRQIESVRQTLRMAERGEQLVVEKVFDGFDHTQYEAEVTERWGADAYAEADRWWHTSSEAERRRYQAESTDIARAFGAALATGKSVDSDEVQAIAQRQYEWLTASWQGQAPTAEHLNGLGEMYVTDQRFKATYDAYGEGTAVFVRDAMRLYIERNLDG